MSTLVAHLYGQVMKKGRIIGLSALVSTMGLILWLTSLGGEGGRREDYHGTIIAAGVVLTLGLLILAVAVLRDEKESGTLPYLYLRPIQRPAFAAGALGAGILASLSLAFVAWALSALGAVAGGIPLTATTQGLVLFGVAAVGYAAIFVPLGYLAPRALLLGLVYVVVIETIIAQAIPSVAHLSIWRISISIYASVVGDLPSWLMNIYVDPLTPGIWGGLAKIAGVVVVGWAVLTWALRKRDAV
jgi:ABC-type transport system involved in multi-copper enzyme maturation permease subunit